MASYIDIHDRLVLNIDQEKFKNTASRAVNYLTHKEKVNGKNQRVYSDFTVSISASMDKRDFDIYRNRTSVLVLSVRGEKVISINFEYVYIEDHLNELLSECKGKELNG